ncbi:hypothetical protein GQ54DRAFT_196930 [Martensiomyces pterosporus]|nr:hypothetical protein GQ54DRAFT_196930 [Martensiomyces pterosporus]
MGLLEKWHAAVSRAVATFASQWSPVLSAPMKLLVRIITSVRPFRSDIIVTPESWLARLNCESRTAQSLLNHIVPAPRFPALSGIFPRPSHCFSAPLRNIVDLNRSKLHLSAPPRQNENCSHSVTLS